MGREWEGIGRGIRSRPPLISPPKGVFLGGEIIKERRDKRNSDAFKKENRLISLPHFLHKLGS